uniref:Fumarate reductase cytochrome b subunit n=1 Tax=Wolinella succinogenes TaxID=844 RepID=UPI0000111225|nr:Chain C, Fumarate reductase cytochrome b subunit [Wolinella succinogenes]1E7P_F Chain F, Fumarate reductase cytochrome b subunit [Wolinella succinogenes]1E7P_I Chain I, Fumarate reductase cytochrome b subunit [Wolinella succinogenes]1E7P_L Chain L, Fumarate reductase cytochrome b subunit [Wolinella succinogenes]
MTNESILESYSGVTPERKKSRMPAKLDWWQSATGLFLGLFMIGHMFFVSTILLGDNVMLWVTKKFQLDFIFEGGKPIVVSFLAAFVFAVFIAHAFLAMRKFPINYRQYLTFKTHKDLMRHGDTTLWWIQAMTGFAMFFLGSVHLYIMMTQPQTIGPVSSSFRMVSEWMWPLYLVLLFAVELHGSVGLYRLAVKWGWFDGETPDKTRANLKKLKTLMSAFLIVLGLLTFGAYVKKGLEQTDPNIDYKYFDYKRTHHR